MASATWKSVQHEFFRDPYAITGELRRVRLLQDIKSGHLICDLLLPNDTQARMSLLVDFSFDDGWIAMDSPTQFPSSAVGLELLVQARPAHLATVWQSRLQDVRDDLLYLEFPEIIYQKQARRLYRVSPAFDDPKRIEIYRNGAPMMLGEILDLSEVGAKVRRVGRSGAYSLHSGERLPKVFFSLRDGTQISSAATARYVGQDSIGLEFADIDSSSRRAIAKYVFERDREILSALGIEPGGQLRRKDGVWNQFKRWLSS